MRLTIIAGARPNFVKIAPIIHAIDRANSTERKISYRLIHTGQHYDNLLSGTFFKELGIPQPDNNLSVGSGTQAEQTGNIMVKFESELIAEPADVVLVVGDVNSTMACSIVAKKLNTAVVHVEAGIRSFDLTMPEEINRMVTDAITDHFFTTSEVANNNLRKAGVSEERIHFVGNTMIDTLMANLPKLRRPKVWEDLDLKEKAYFVLTLHRPANVDQESKLQELLLEIVEHSRGIPLVFPAHPRTAKVLRNLGVQQETLRIIEPLGYLEFIYLIKQSKAVITDSGGIQEETTVLNVPCITLRDNTERPETVEVGTNKLIGTDPRNIAPTLNGLFTSGWKNGGLPPLWDGKTSERIIKKLTEIYIK